MEPREIRPSQVPGGFVYIGPDVDETGFWQGYCVYVYVLPERGRDGWWVTTAQLKRA